jgi:thymidine kinase
MIKVIYGRKGAGKIKTLIDTANDFASKSKGDVVFIDDSDQLICDLKHEIRFINVSEFPVAGTSAFLGFICGVISEDYDIDGIFIDGLTYILKQNVDSLKEFFDSLKTIAIKYNIKFYMTINGAVDETPDFIKEYIA